MSYEIVYGRQFVKCEHGILPLVLTGSNNCYMYYGGKDIRERYWTRYGSERGKVAMSAEAIMAWANQFVPSTYQQHFMKGGKWVDDNGFIAFMQNGIKNAHTLEEIREANIGQTLNCYIEVYHNDHDSWSGAWTRHCEACAHNTAELDAWIDKAEAEYKELAKNKDNDVFICTRFDGIKPLKPYKKIDGKVIAKYKKNYVCEVRENRGFTSSADISKAIVFDSIEQAKSQIHSFYHNDLTFVSADNALKAHAEKNYCIACNAQYGYGVSGYVSKVSSRRLWSAFRQDGAQKFTLAEAKRWIAKYQERYASKCTFEIVELA